jgi:hypothetical protein
MENILSKINENNFNKLIKEIKKQKDDENKLFLLILIITGICIYIDNIAPLLFIFLLFYYENNKQKILNL